MKTIVFLVSGYYPNFSAVGKCIYNIAEVMSNHHEVIVISEKTSFNQKNLTYNNTKIIFIENKSTHKRLKINTQLNSINNLYKFYYLTLKYLIKLKKASMFIFSKNTLDNKLVESFNEALINLRTSIDLIYPVSLPIESVIAALNYKDSVNTTNVYPILFDKFSNNIELNRFKIFQKIKFKQNLKIEREIFFSSNGIFHLESWRNHISDHNLNSKFITEIKHPLLIKNQTIICNNDNRKIKIVYLGALYKKIRSPKFILDLYMNSKELSATVELKFIIRGKVPRLIYKASRSDNNIYLENDIDSQKASDEMLQADILLSIGNFDTSQFPSKIMDYISTGKPIIHTFKSQKDTVISVLERYNNCLLINENDDSNSVERIIEFINKIQIVEFEKIEKIFYDETPEYIYKTIENFSILSRKSGDSNE